MMMKRKWMVVALCLCFTMAFGSTALAAEPEEAAAPDNARFAAIQEAIGEKKLDLEKIKANHAEKRAAHSEEVAERKAKMQEMLEDMTPEEREAWEAKMEEMRANMKEKMAEMKENRANRPNKLPMKDGEKPEAGKTPPRAKRNGEKPDFDPGQLKPGEGRGFHKPAADAEDTNN